MEIFLSQRGPGGETLPRKMCEMFTLCVLRQVVCAAAGGVGTERGDQGDTSQQPAERCSHLGCAVLGFPLAGPAGNSGSTGLYAYSCNHGAGQVEHRHEQAQKSSHLRRHV